MNPHTPTLELTQLSKKLGGREVLKQVDLIVQPGEVVGIVGSNGSGKTTLLRLVTGLIYPDRGVIRVKGKRVRPGLLGDLPLSVGALIETPSFLPQFSGFQNLTMLASIQQKIDKTDVYQVMKQVGLDPENRKPVRTYSLGMRQRLGIAQAVMEDPCLLLFDEPTNALDDHGVETFSSLLQELIEKGASVLLVSHVKGEIQRFCDRVFQIEEGKLLSRIREYKAKMETCCKQLG